MSQVPRDGRPAHPQLASQLLLGRPAGNKTEEAATWVARAVTGSGSPEPECRAQELDEPSPPPLSSLDLLTPVLVLHSRPLTAREVLHLVGVYSAQEVGPVPPSLGSLRRCEVATAAHTLKVCSHIARKIKVVLRKLTLQSR